MLIECMVYLSVIAVILLLGMTALFHGLKQHYRISQGSTDITRALGAGERWRADLRAAGRPPAWHDDKDGPQLRVASGTNTIRYAFRTNTVWRSTDGLHWQPVLAGVKTSRMTALDRPPVTAWQWDVELVSHARSAVKPWFTFTTVVTNSPGQP